MREVQFSTMIDLSPASGLLEGFFDPFTLQRQLKAKSLYMHWFDSWNQLVQFGLSSHGPDVSEVGSTWLGSFDTMESLRPFSAGETALFGTAQNYPTASWKACRVEHNDTMLAIPWTVDIRVVLYRRDWLQKSGVDELTGFADFDHFDETLQKLKAAGHPSPLGLTTSQSHTRLIHDIASWVWSAGGELRSDDGKKMLLLEPKSRAGLNAYFALNQFISPEMHDLTEVQVWDALLADKTAVAILPERAYLDALSKKSGLPFDVTENIGVAMLMKAPYIGGSHLVIWRHAADYQDSLKLAQYLCSMQAWKLLNKQHLPFTPARLDILDQSPLATTPFYSAIQQTLKHGRTFHSGYRWNGVEGRLVSVIQQMWTDLRADPALNIADEVEKRFSAACKRLEQTILASSW